MFYWHLLNKDQEELLYKFLAAQQLSTSKNDWIQQVRKDMKEIKLELNDETIKNMSKNMFKNIVKRKIEEYAVKYLRGIKNSQSKISNLEIRKLEPAEYLTSPDLNKEEVKNLYKLRNRMLDLKENFKFSHQQNMWCRCCFLFPETQPHLMQCPVILNKLKNKTDIQSSDYNMVFSNLKNQVKMAKLFTIILKKRLDIIEELEK